MKSAAAILLLSIAVVAYVFMSRMQASHGEPSPPVEPVETAPAPAVIEDSADDTSRAAYQVFETEPVTVPVPKIGERELSERLWTIFNADLQDQTQFVEHEPIAELIRNDPELARALAKEAAQ